MKRHVLGSCVLILTAFAFLAALRGTTPSYAYLTGPIGISGAAHENVVGRTLAAEVGTVRLAKVLRAKLYGKDVERDTSGIWAVVNSKIEATSQTATMQFAVWLGPSGRQYAATRRLEGAPGFLLGATLQPGLPRNGIFIFELPPDEIENGVLLLSTSPLRTLDTELRLQPQTSGLSQLSVLELTRDGG
ncbi:MAG: hypothetical protein ACRECW_06175 [Phyllobacterium sp.]